MPRICVLAALFGVLVSQGVMAAEQERAIYDDLLSSDAVGAREFIRNHPEWDGRGVVVAVLDTGVDMSVPGLRVTSTGEVKVIEARDFSGQGVVHLLKPSETDENGESVLKTREGVIRGAERLSPPPVKDSLLLGFLEEERFRNSSVSDVNENGKKDDRFGILVGKVVEKGKERWVAWVDTDADGHVDDEAMQENYSESRKFFFFKAQAHQDGSETMAIALQIEANRREVTLHFPDGSHGTHVAGIAAGFELYGKKGFNGIAPGAQVMSLKIGDNTLSGGSTTTESMKRALEFAGTWSEKNNTPVVVNMSYGIGTEKEGESDIDLITDRIIKKYPLLSVATSAGNSGPGLSTVGTPAGALLAFSTGALLTRSNARTLYNANITRDVLFYFSSRGGELSKPDGVAPGAAISTVPPWEKWIVMRGTSMASPQIAGCMALLASAAITQKGGMKFNGGMLTTALRNSGRPLKGFSMLDQGSGLVYVPGAWESLKILSSRKSAAAVAGFQSSADCPTCPDGRARAAWLRAGTWIPKRPEAVAVSITPVFMGSFSEKEREEWFETFDLSIDGDWLELDTDTLVFHGPGSVSLDVFYKPEKLRKPGLYTARIRATSRETRKGKGATVFEIWNSVVVPVVFDITQGYEKTWRDEELPPGELKRYFLRVPEGATSLLIEMSPVKGKYSQSRLCLFDPEGHEYHFEEAYSDSRENKKARVLVPRDELKPGIWEAVVFTHYVARGTSHYDLEVVFSGFHFEPPTELTYEQGSNPSASFTLSTVFDKTFRGQARGAIYGFGKSEEYFTSGDKLSIPLTLEKDTQFVRLKFTMAPDTYARFTDIAINVNDESGSTVVKEGFSSRFVSFEVSNPRAGKGAASFTIEILGALAERTRRKWGVALEEVHEQVAHYPARVWCDGFADFTLYPNKEYTCELELKAKPPITPSGYRYYGELKFRESRTGRDMLIVPLRLDLKR